MASIEPILSLFPKLNHQQREQIASLEELYLHWNAQINVISRKDIASFYQRHVLHSLCIGKYFNLNNYSVVDVGTGGGFPGIPLAILFPDAQFTLIDSIGKKLKVVDAVAEAIGLNNVQTRHTRMEEIKGSYDFVTGRAVKSLPVIMEWTGGLLSKKTKAKESGMLYLKGGDFIDELEELKSFRHTVYSLKDLIPGEEFFETKKLVHLRKYDRQSNLDSVGD